jgi:hypothetical protein
MTLDENDLLTFQLYTASKTPRIRNGRIRTWILMTVTFLLFAYLFYESSNDSLTVYFLSLAGLSAIFAPFYTRWKYKRHYLKYIRDTFKNRLGQECTLIIDSETVGTKSNSEEVKIKKSEIEEINEIKDYYFLKARSGTTLLISKLKTDNLEEIEDLIRSLVERYGVRHNIELNWKWR